MPLPDQSGARCTSFTGRHKWGRWIGDRWHSACWVTGSSLGYVTCKRCGARYLTVVGTGQHHRTFASLASDEQSIRTEPTKSEED